MAAHDNGAYVKAIVEHFQPIGCGKLIGGTFGRKPVPCEVGGAICSACWDRRNRRDEALEAIAKVAG